MLQMDILNDSYFTILHDALKEYLYSFFKLYDALEGYFV